MARLRGAGLGAGMALGGAAVVQVRGGVALMPEAPPRLAALAAQRRLSETPDVVVVAADYAAACAIAASLHWARVVGIASEGEPLDARVPEVPAVTGVPGLMKAVADDLLILVDATRGVVLVDPDPLYLAQYTAEHDRIAPRSRLFLDEEHLAAQTLDGHSVRVIALAGSDDLETAMQSGPDAVYHGLPITFDSAAFRASLTELLTLTSGKPLLIPSVASMPLAPIVEAASQCDLTLIAGVREGEPTPSDADMLQLRQDIELAQADCVEQDRLFATPRLAAEFELSSPSAEPVNGRLESLAAAGVTGLLCSAEALDAETLQSLADSVAVSSVNLMPVTFYVAPGLVGADGADEAGQEELARLVRLLIGAGVTGLLADASLIQRLKRVVRASSSSECREELARTLSASAASV